MIEDRCDGRMRYSGVKGPQDGGVGLRSRTRRDAPWTDSAVRAFYMTLILITICFWLCSSRRTVPDAEVHRGVRLVDRLDS